MCLGLDTRAFPRVTALTTLRLMICLLPADVCTVKLARIFRVLPVTIIAKVI